MPASPRLPGHPESPICFAPELGSLDKMRGEILEKSPLHPLAGGYFASSGGLRRAATACPTLCPGDDGSRGFHASSGCLPLACQHRSTALVLNS